MDKWAYERGIELDLSRPGTPIDNVKVESFNGRFRAGVFKPALVSVTGRRIAQDGEWRRYYSEICARFALQWATPAEFAWQARVCRKSALPQQPDFSM